MDSEMYLRKLFIIPSYNIIKIFNYLFIKDRHGLYHRLKQLDLRYRDKSRFSALK